MIPGSEWGASSERAGVMVVRIWVEGAHDSLRARLTHTLDLDGAEQTTQTAASVEEILKVVREWLHVFAEAGATDRR